MQVITVGDQPPEEVAVTFLTPPMGDRGVSRVATRPGWDECGQPEAEHERRVYHPAVTDDGDGLSIVLTSDAIYRRPDAQDELTPGLTTGRERAEGLFAEVGQML